MQIYIQRNGEDFGPYSLEEMNRYLAEGSMSPRDRAWHEGIEGWIPLAEVE